MTTPTLDGTHALMRHDLTAVVLATGGKDLVRAAYSVGKPAYGVGPGNAPCYVEASAVMARVHPFFESAGMRRVDGDGSKRDDDDDTNRRAGTNTGSRDDTGTNTGSSNSTGDATNSRFTAASRGSATAAGSSGLPSLSAAQITLSI